ncbi:MAG: uroporphyrinogen decarboxylase [Myxococcales bacterium]|nr:uroporphyrinogen decarboxylase [Myxococcales bacterium]
MSTFLAACRREPVDHTPIWLMRQAGRYQPEYRAIRERVSFIELCQTPELACEVTVRAVDQLGVDAAIIFADILLVLDPLRIGFEFTSSDGPRILEPVRTAEQVDAVAETIEPAASLGYVMDAIRLARAALDVPLIGFAGAPFTLASYAIEGGGSRTYYETKKIMYGDEGLWNTLMAKLSTAVADYLNAQIAAGAQAVQLFDSWVGCLSPSDYGRYVEPHVRSIFDRLDRSVPSIHFGTGNPALYQRMRAAGGDVIGVDWRVSLDAAWRSVGQDAGVMGNLDPASLLAPRHVMFERARAVLDQAAGRPGHVFNLGHGVMPEASVDQARALVDFVHEASAR